MRLPVIVAVIVIAFGFVPASAAHGHADHPTSLPSGSGVDHHSISVDGAYASALFGAYGRRLGSVPVPGDAWRMFWVLAGGSIFVREGWIADERWSSEGDLAALDLDEERDDRFDLPGAADRDAEREDPRDRGGRPDQFEPIHGEHREWDRALDDEHDPDRSVGEERQ